MSIIERSTLLVTADFVDGLRHVVGGDRVSVDREYRISRSTDHSFLSPSVVVVGSPTVADVVISPRDTISLARAMALAHRAGVAVVPRGQGTTTGGQAVPSGGGMVVDSDGRDRVLDVGLGWIDAEAGATFVELERAARASGQELALMPSTTGSALGGFLAGGRDGTGSLEHGSVGDGFVLEVDVLPAWDVPEPITAVGDAVGPFLGAYGTTGMVVGARVRLVPARVWTALFASFPGHDLAMAAARSLAALDPPPRQLAVDDAELVGLLPAYPGLVAGRASLRACVELGTAAAARRIITDVGGTTELCSEAAVPRLTSLAHEHVVLWARHAGAGLRYVRVEGEAVDARPGAVRACVPGGALLHHDFGRRGPTRTTGTLLIGELAHPEVAEQTVDRLQALGLDVARPSYRSTGRTGEASEAGQAQGLQAAAVQFDPKGLLNPGKLPGSHR